MCRKYLSSLSLVFCVYVISPLILLGSACVFADKPLVDNSVSSTPWILIDNFESGVLSADWIKKDTKNNTKPRVENPQVTDVLLEDKISENILSENVLKNYFLLKKPAAEGVVGNRKALTFKKLPVEIPVGETYTIFSRVNIEYFPNNHVYGLSNLDAKGIEENDYNAFEPSLRITDKFESNGYKNDGTLMVKTHEGYAKIIDPLSKREAKPAQTNVWYDIWLVVNNNTLANGGQTYDVYVRGGEFKTQKKVYSDANFRMEREKPLTYFLMNCNTGPSDKPYGNGGVRYDDLYMRKGIKLDYPVLFDGGVKK